MGRSLNNQFNNDNPKDIGKKIAVALLYYGLLHINKVKKLQLKDLKISMTEDAEVNFP